MELLDVLCNGWYRRIGVLAPLQPGKYQNSSVKAWLPLPAEADHATQSHSELGQELGKWCLHGYIPLKDCQEHLHCPLWTFSALSPRECSQPISAFKQNIA